MTLVDRCGRPLLNLRVAVTRQCNLRCEYCHMEGEDKQYPPSHEMTADEIVRIVRVAAGLGISRVKLTGGEPLLRKDIVEIVRGIAAIKDVSDLSMTTNGTMLEHLAEDLRSNGLDRVNVTLPTLDAEAYEKLNGGKIEPVLRGLEAAVKAGLCPVKVNVLLLKGVNDDAVFDMIEFAKKTGVILQLIELEPLNISSEYYLSRHMPLDKYERMLDGMAERTETRKFMQNRKVYHLQDTSVEIIHPTENAEFCSHCTRLRVTSEGKLKPCLMTKDNLVDILTPLRSGASDEELAELFKMANDRRKPYNSN
ncbi:GTP 3',8-cyclase MoaA [Candidatus Bathyarchaeota archaeon]|nr:GTP 3',8-cyclase MoaA [Candidatus Bathyarchaeota archaeon]